MGLGLELIDLFIPNLDNIQEKAVKDIIQNMLYSVFESLNFYNPNDINISLKDYIDFVQSKKDLSQGES